MASNSVLKPLAPKVSRKLKTESEVVSSTTTQQNTKKRKACAYHPTLGYAIPPPVPAKVARRNARERNRVKQVSFILYCTMSQSVHKCPKKSKFSKT